MPPTPQRVSDYEGNAGSQCFCLPQLPVLFLGPPGPPEVESPELHSVALGHFLLPLQTEPLLSRTEARAGGVFLLIANTVSPEATSGTLMSECLCREALGETAAPDRDKERRVQEVAAVDPM